MHNLMEAALSYAAKGYLVFPCKPREKVPATKHGLKDATRDERTLREWWSENPEYNVAIRTGKESNLVVLDIDEGGEETLADRGLGVGTAVVITGKGFHAYYEHPGFKVGNKVKFLPGLDLKGDGGYVIAPPSIHPSGKVYEWEAGLDAKVNEYPGWLTGEQEVDTEVGVLMSDVTAEKIEWLWQDRIPLGKLTVLDSDPGLGKSVITMDLAARVTNGASFPNGDVHHVGNLDHVVHVGGVVILSAEDGLADTIKPRLDAAGADSSKVVAISTVPDSRGNERTIAIPEDTVTIEAAIRRVDAKLVIVDPLMAFLSGKANYDQDVRKALTPLARMAESTGVAVLVVRHLNKQQGGKALYRGGSSIGIIGAARSGLVVEEHPDNKDLRVLAMNKSNLSEKAASLTYSVTTAENDAAKAVWGTTTELDADDVLNPDTSEVGKAKEWLTDKLRDMPWPTTTVLKEGKEVGFSEKTIRRAKDALNVKSKKDGQGGCWRWHLEDSQRFQDCQDTQHAQEFEPVIPDPDAELQDLTDEDWHFVIERWRELDERWSIG
jgi:RecA-family ATPase